ncbi:MAG: hypothetical protein K0U38_07395 [Epsilonproteobacteria bacterium]|nr:hypothetical protein [Campylobacterota bacterium]
MTYTGNKDNLGLDDNGVSIRIAQKNMRPQYWDHWNVRDDLKKYEPDNEFISLEKFIIRGDILLSRLTASTDAYGFEAETISYEEIK